MGRMRHYAVTVQGFGPRTYAALSPAAARAEAWRDYTSAYECSFREFLERSTVHRCDAPEDDGYGYVRRAYGVDPKLGERVRLINEGSSTGLEGEICYPGQSTAHVIVLIDGRKHPVAVHPTNIEATRP